MSEFIRIGNSIINLDNVTNIHVGTNHVSILLLPGDGDSLFVFEGEQADALRWWLDGNSYIQTVMSEYAAHRERKAQREEFERARIAHEALCQQGVHTYSQRHHCVWCTHYDATAPVDPELAQVDYS